jgi:hypothetical protein
MFSYSETRLEEVHLTCKCKPVHLCSRNKWTQIPEELNPEGNLRSVDLVIVPRVFKTSKQVLVRDFSCQVGEPLPVKSTLIDRSVDKPGPSLVGESSEDSDIDHIIDKFKATPIVYFRKRPTPKKPWQT